MNTELQSKLDILRTDYNNIRGQPFQHFFCPFLFEDADVPLCQAHIINQSFPDSARNWTVGRKDIDNFYGSHFEADFAGILYHEYPSIGKIFVDKDLSKQFRPTITLDEQPVEYFFAKKSGVPEGFTRLNIEFNGQVVELGLKMPPSDVFATQESSWGVAISKDMRIATIVSLIKSAYLTLFEMLGYSYALSPDGYFVGLKILGQFFRENRNKSRADVFQEAQNFFSEFIHMVRPVQSQKLNLRGTITDKLLFVCGSDKSAPWAFIVFIKTSQMLHAVLMPIFDQADSVAKFLDFLKSENEMVDVRYCKFENDHWEIDKNLTQLKWIKTGILYP